MKKKLALHRETLRRLSGPNLSQVAGASGSGNTCDTASLYQCGGSYTYCDERFCASGSPHCADSQANSWCICTE
jgi:hypothetical protein